MSLRIIFMGTPAFAVPSLEILVENGYEIAAVVTTSDKTGGRGGKQLLQSAVKQYAQEQGLPVLQPERLRDPDFLEQLRGLKADLQVVVAFRMLPEAVWAMPRLGTFNLHGSLLPRYRGAAPINWAIINGEKETGVTTFFIQHEIDTGDVILQERLDIGPDETAGELHDRMMGLGANVVLKTVQLIEAGGYTLQKQDDALASKAPKLFHETCRIDLNQTTQQVHNFIRGLSPYPGAWTILDGQELKIFRAAISPEPLSHPPGTFVSDNKRFIRLSTLDGYVELLELQLPGRKRLTARDFLNGFSF